MQRRYVAMFSSHADYDIQCGGNILCEMIFAPCPREDSQFHLRREIEASPIVRQLFQSIHPSLIMIDSENLYLVLQHQDNVLQQHSPHQRTALCALLSTLLIKLALNRSQHNSPNNVRLIADAQAYIFKHRMEDINNRQVARRLGVSCSYLQAMFSKHKHHTLKDYILHVRIDDAALLLLFSDKTVEQVALTCGFHSRQSFSRAFSNQMGISPSEYRRQNLDGIHFRELSYPSISSASTGSSRHDG